MYDRSLKRIDMVVGLQYGDEGKGSACATLHKMNEYNFSLRGGGSQAEHRFEWRGKFYRFRVNPVLSIDKIDTYLGAGMIARKDIYEQEIKQFGLDKDKCHIDHNTAIVSGQAYNTSKRSKSQGRGGYSMGISGTLCQKMKRIPGDKILAKHYDMETVNVAEEVYNKVKQGQTGLIEGSQGVLLSLNHGFFPCNTSYDVIPDAILSQVGVNHELIDEIYGVIKTFPTRVAGTQGICHMGGRPITFEEISERAGIDIPEYRKNQTDEDNSLKGREFISRFSEDDFRKSLILSRPTKLIVTHLDWLPENKRENFIKKVESIARKTLRRECPVVIARYGQGEDDYEVR